MKMVSLKAAG